MRHVRPAVRHAAGRRFALSQTLDRTSTNTATNAKHRGKNHRELFLAHLRTDLDSSFQDFLY